jgi:hypothetical protein
MWHCDISSLSISGKPIVHELIPGIGIVFTESSSSGESKAWGSKMCCLDRVIVLNERHLRRILTCYIDYYHRWRTHLSLGMDSPESQLV